MNFDTMQFVSNISELYKLKHVQILCGCVAELPI